MRTPVVPLVLTLLAASCSTPSEPNDSTRPTFDIEVSGEVFTVQVATQGQADELRARLRTGARGVVSGQLAAGDGGVNTGYAWHLTPATVHAPDVAIELCDGRPSMVSADRAYWLGTVRQFCPWGARVVRER